MPILSFKPEQSGTIVCEISISSRQHNTQHGQQFQQYEQEAFEKCWAHSPLRAAARPNFTLPFTRCRYCRTPPAHRCPRQRRRLQRQQQ